MPGNNHGTNGPGKPLPGYPIMPWLVNILSLAGLQFHSHAVFAPYSRFFIANGINSRLTGFRLPTAWIKPCGTILLRLDNRTFRMACNSLVGACPGDGGRWVNFLGVVLEQGKSIDSLCIPGRFTICCLMVNNLAVKHRCYVNQAALELCVLYEQLWQWPLQRWNLNVYQMLPVFP